MTGTEKVIECFEKLREYADSEVHPVVSPDNWNIYSELRDLIDKAEKDTLALLKEQEPRAMTLEKTQTALRNDDVVWVEIKDKIICGGIRMDGTDYFTMQNGDVLDVTDFDSGEGTEMYGREVRCWTSRPTDAQREATPWN